MKTLLRFLSIILVVGGLAWAQQGSIGVTAVQTAPPAGTEITNQAFASFLDAAGNAGTAASNIVVTIVTPVFAFTITPDGTEEEPGQRSATPPGGTVQFEYRIDNASNAADTILLQIAQTGAFSLENVQIFLDANCDGTADTTTPIEGNPFGDAQTAPGVTVPAGAVVCVVVTGQVPTEIVGNVQRANLNLIGTSTNDPNIVDSNNWARIVATQVANLELIKTTTPPSGSTVAPTDTIGISLNGSNIGDLAAEPIANVATVDGAPATGILISDLLFQGTVFVPGSLTTTTPGAQILFSTDGGATWTTTQPAEGVNAVGLLIPDVIPDGGTFDLSYEVTVPAGTPAGTTLATPRPAYIIYDAEPGPGVEQIIESSNVVTLVVGAVGAVQIGSRLFGEDATYQATNPQTGREFTFTVIDADLQEVTSPVRGGNVIPFINTVLNNGNSGDTFTLGFDPATLPAGWTVQFFTPDGQTPIENIFIPQGESRNVMVKIALPPEAVVTAQTDVVITATSATDPTQTDSTTNRIPFVTVGFGVDIAPQPGVPTEVDAERGDQLTFPLQITNTGANNDNFNLGFDLPPGWNVAFYEDLDCNGTPDTQSAITSTGILEPDQTYCVVAVVTVAPDAAEGPATVVFTATSQLDPTITDSVTFTVTITVGLLALEKLVDGELSPPEDPTHTAAPGEQITYTVTGTNLGSSDLRRVTVNDRVPEFTDFVSVTATLEGFPAGATVVYSTLNTAANSGWVATAPTALPNRVIHVAVDTNSDGQITQLDRMPPGATITITLVVQVRGITQP